MHTDLQFKAANHDHINESLTFIPHSGHEIKLKCYQEKPRHGDSALVQLAKLTVTEDQSVKVSSQPRKSGFRDFSIVHLNINNF